METSEALLASSSAGGVALMSAQNGISANFGFQKVLIDGGDVMFGVNLVFGFR